MNHDWTIRIKKFFFLIFKNSALLENDQLLEQLKCERFDVAIAETMDPCPMAMFHHVGAKTTLAASALPVLTPIVIPYGVPSPSSFIPGASLCTFDKYYFE
jgi:hypothetical protein